MNSDISTTLISDDTIRQKLPSIFIDSMVVDPLFNIIVVSQNVLDFLAFTNEEVKDKNINYLAGTDDLAASLKNALRSGYFEERRTCFFSKNNQRISIGISGFYLGLISNINGCIILKIKNLDGVVKINQQMEEKKVELDNFIYRTAHDLRGPLATIKGLLNLLKMRQNNEELERILPLLEAHANKLDERLFHLIYLAQIDLDTDSTRNYVDFNVLETILRKTIEQNAFIDFLEFNYAAPEENVSGLNETLMTSLLSNLLLYILSLPMSPQYNQLFFRIIQEDGCLKITIGVHGFITNLNLRAAIGKNDFIYTDMINYPQLVNFYAAKKTALKLNTSFQFHFIGEDKQRITLTTPLHQSNQLPLF